MSDSRGRRTVALDVTDPATIVAAAGWIERQFGRLDVLVNNAGITGSGQVSPADALDQTPARWIWTWCGQCSRPTSSG